jgi:uncharacterized protein YecT (DUF1311 family)
MKSIILIPLFLVSSCIVNAKSIEQNVQIKFEKSDVQLNEIYNFINNLIYNEKNEVLYIKNGQREWLKKRNIECKYNGYSSLNIEQMKCLTPKNQERINYLRFNYLNSEILIGREIFPVSDDNYSSILIKNGSIKFINCKKEVGEYKIFSTKKNMEYNENYQIEFEIDSNNNGVPDYSLTFVTSGMNTWKVLFNRIQFIKNIEQISEKYTLNNKDISMKVCHNK